MRRITFVGEWSVYMNVMVVVVVKSLMCVILRDINFLQFFTPKCSLIILLYE